jgi:predicted MFS family arabinose efflux permease
MKLRHIKIGCFVLEGINAFATAFFFNYLFFYMQQQFAFDRKHNLMLSALNGFVYMFAAWFGGRFAQKHGYFFALRLGFAIMALSLALGSQMTSPQGVMAAMVGWTLGMCFTWPTLEALVSEGESRQGLARMVGIYNIVWATTAALAFFFGGALFERLGPKSLFWLPVILHLVQLELATWLKQKATSLTGLDPAIRPDPQPVEKTRSTHSVAEAKSFLRMAWIANPFAYIAISALIPLIPDLTLRLGLSPTQAGFFCSIFFFARLGTFAWLWQWSGWHYHFGWLAGAYVALIGSFAAILLIPKLWVIVLAQILFGLAIGLIYYSSLFYSMDAGDSKGEHGGLHEAAIGTGIFAGPATGAIAIHWLPNHPNSSIWAVTLLLLAGFVAMVITRARTRPSANSD